ncbi:sodium:solute symporter [Armatimonas sp.]|uniref:sodium:solute symporter family protein n=1 Tax=Armatimonas sp. TaxID=1872638 RepID=UPI003751AF87
MGPLIVILIYMAVVTYIGSVAVRQSKKNSTEDFFLAGRSIGPMVFFLSLFATNMTAFAILGSSGAAYKQGVGIFGMMASSSGFMIPLTIFLIGTRLWALGKRFGHMTQVAFFRDRWECSGIGTFIFALSAAMIVPYMIISIIGGGTVLQEISGGLVPYWLGCLLVTLVVTLTVFLGGMRGTVWVNVFQTILFMLFGTIALIAISSSLEGGFGAVLTKLGASPKGFLLSRERMPAEVFWSYSLIPLSSIMFPHMSIMCLSAKKMSAFKNTVVAYPLAIMAVWLPSVFLGIVGAGLFPRLQGAEPDGILLKLLTEYAPVWISGILGAGIISVVMGSDAHQVLALSTMFTKDIFDHYGGRKKFGEKSSILFARGFIVVLTVVAYLIALVIKQGIFEIAVRFAFSGFAALAPIMIAALFWKRSTKWGALAAAIWVAICLFVTGYLTNISEPMGQKMQAAQAAAAKAPPPPPGAPKKKPITELPIYPELGRLFLRAPTQITIMGYLPVVPMVVGSALLMLFVSLGTKPPSKETVEKYFPSKTEK